MDSRTASGVRRSPGRRVTRPLSSSYESWYGEATWKFRVDTIGTGGASAGTSPAAAGANGRRTIHPARTRAASRLLPATQQVLELPETVFDLQVPGDVPPRGIRGALPRTLQVQVFPDLHFPGGGGVRGGPHGGRHGHGRTVPERFSHDEPRLELLCGLGEAGLDGESVQPHSTADLLVHAPDIAPDGHGRRPDRAGGAAGTRAGGSQALRRDAERQEAHDVGPAQRRVGSEVHLGFLERPADRNGHVVVPL